jgi:N-acetylmuramoyl-L-alanine amidase
VVRFRVCLQTFLALSAVIGVFVLQAQQTDEEKPTRILKARAVSSSSPDETPSPTPKPKTSPRKKKKTPTPSPKPKSKAKAKKTTADESEASPTPSETPEATPKPKAKKKTAEKEPSPKTKKKKKTAGEKSPSPHKKTSPKPSETPEIRSSASPPRAIAVPSPTAPPPPRSASTYGGPVEEPEQLTIEKYGYEKPQGFWARLFGGGGRRSSSGAGYRYLTASVRNQIDRAPVARSRWQYIVVHNSGTRQGNAAAFDYYHRHFRRMQNGLAYHFVIGNGTSTGNGQIEVGDRWRRQINGGHVHSDYLNNIALGICLVGDFNRDQPTRAQLDCCEELIRYLRQRCGKVGDHYPIVKPHRDVNPPRWATDCPGDVFPYSWFRRFQE